MWRAFGGTGTRVGIVLRIPFASMSGLHLALTFSPVAYLSESSAHGVIDEVVANVRANRDYLRTLKREFLSNLVFQIFVAGIVCLKHEGFHEEREWRAIHTPKRWSSPLMESSTEVVAGVPQVVYKAPLDVSVSPLLADLDFVGVLDRLIVGPTPYRGRSTVRSSKRSKLPGSRTHTSVCSCRAFRSAHKSVIVLRQRGLFCTLIFGRFQTLCQPRKTTSHDTKSAITSRSPDQPQQPDHRRHNPRHRRAC